MSGLIQHEFLFRECRVYKETATSVTRYAKDMSAICGNFGVGIGMEYDKKMDILRFVVRSVNAVATAAVFVSLLAGTLILGGEQAREWKPIMGKAYKVLEENPDKAGEYLDKLALLQIDLANALRMRSKKAPNEYDMHMEFAT